MCKKCQKNIMSKKYQLNFTLILMEDVGKSPAPMAQDYSHSIVWTVEGKRNIIDEDFWTYVSNGISLSSFIRNIQEYLHPYWCSLPEFQPS